MTFFNSIKMCYMKSFDFKGRASKSEYWWFWLVQVPITFIALGAWNSEKFDVLSGVFLGITIASIPANLSSMVRRFHDAGLSTKQCLKKLSYAVAPFLFCCQFNDNDRSFFFFCCSTLNSIIIFGSLIFPVVHHIDRRQCI